MEAADRSLYDQTYAAMCVGEDILTGDAARQKAKNKRPKQSEVTYLEDGDIVEFGNDGKMTYSVFGPQVPVIITSKNGAKRGLALFLSTFGKSFVVTDENGKYLDLSGNPTTTPMRAKTVGEPAKTYTSAPNADEAYTRFFGKRVKFTAHTYWGERPVYDNGTRIGKEIAQQTVYDTEWV